MIRVVELFSGIGSQAKALSRLGVDYEIVNTCEWDFHSILAYERIHKSGRSFPDLESMDKSELLQEISRYTLSNNGKDAATDTVFREFTADALRAILSAIRTTHNFVDISSVNPEDMPENIDILTYSFPCQDLSNVGAFHGYNKGIDRGADNRSGLLWEVERILWGMKNAKRELPRFLLMENVVALTSDRHRENFSDWQNSLRELGYTNQVYCLNALDFGLPQNRLRLFMLSILTGGDQQAEQTVQKYLADHDLGNAAYLRTLAIPFPELKDYLKTDYDNEIYFSEAIECQSNDTPSRRRIWENNLKIVDENGKIAPYVGTLTTKQDRDPNSGNLYMPPSGDRGKFRYLTPRECMILMGFDEEDYEKIIRNNVLLKKGTMAFTRDRIIRMAGNSIAVNVLEYLFRQMLELIELMHQQAKPGRKKYGTDVHDPETRSYNMRRIKAKDTKPEKIVSCALHNAGFRRYKEGGKGLPGTPDFVIKGKKTAVFVNGCFWHGHNCRYFHWPQSNAEFWKQKIM